MERLACAIRQPQRQGRSGRQASVVLAHTKAIRQASKQAVCFYAGGSSGACKAGVRERQPHLAERGAAARDQRPSRPSHDEAQRLWHIIFRFLLLLLLQMSSRVGGFEKAADKLPSVPVRERPSRRLLLLWHRPACAIVAQSSPGTAGRRLEGNPSLPHRSGGACSMAHWLQAVAGERAAPIGCPAGEWAALHGSAAREPPAQHPAWPAAGSPALTPAAQAATEPGKWHPPAVLART